MNKMNSRNSTECIYYKYITRVHNLRKYLSNISNDLSTSIETVGLSPQDDIYTALAKVSINLANSYHQIKKDIDSPDRISWSGTAHEIRETIRILLELLAPDKEISLESWYHIEKNCSGPTQKQRVKYILQKQSASSRQEDVVKLISNVDDLVGNMVRATYSRGSDAAHRGKDRKECKRLLKYFEAFTHDLLNIP